MRDASRMQQSLITFNVDGIALEGIVAKPQEPAVLCPMAVLCHPHPGLGGTMQHPLLEALAQALALAGVATLRFNFRGVGGSQGTFTNGEQEWSDVRAAVQLANAWPGVRTGRVGVVGYSFGAGVILRARDKLKGIRAAAFIAPPPTSFASSRFLKERLPKLFLVGEQDKVAPPEQIKALVASATGATEVLTVPKVNHAWRGGEAQTADHCAAFLARHLF